MSERDGHEHGVPCWVDTGQPDPEAAVCFYTQLFGWEAEDVMPPDSEQMYFVCRLRGRDVAAVGSQPSEAARTRAPGGRSRPSASRAPTRSTSCRRPSGSWPAVLRVSSAGDCSVEGRRRRDR
jgi:hypothetical protein